VEWEWLCCNPFFCMYERVERRRLVHTCKENGRRLRPERSAAEVEYFECDGQTEKKEKKEKKEKENAVGAKPRRPPSESASACTTGSERLCCDPILCMYELAGEAGLYTHAKNGPLPERSAAAEVIVIVLCVCGKEKKTTTRLAKTTI
jgi:hypothetical protein